MLILQMADAVYHHWVYSHFISGKHGPNYFWSAVAWT